MTGSTPPSRSEGRSVSAANLRNPYIAFLPWLALGVVSRYSSVQAGAAVALAAAIVIALPSLAAGKPKLLELAGIIAFAAFLAVAVVTDAHSGGVLFRYCRAIAAGTLSLIAFGSLLFIPFTEQYARETVPRELWGTTRFRETNRVLTAAWGGVFALMAVSHTIAGALNTTRDETIFNWVIPILLLVQTIKWMERYRTGRYAPTEASVARR
jgi:hypothetical protein